MSSKLLLRIASVLMLVHGILHTIGFNSWKTDPDPARHAVMQAMNGPRLPFMGTNRNMADYYDGFGYASTIALALIAVSLWIVSGELASSSLAKKMILTLAIILAFWGIDEIIFFFPFATSMSMVSSLCCFLAFFKVNKQA
ncbi:MAG: LIC_13387 family protein [Mucilaginibacter sp.]